MLQLILRATLVALISAAVAYGTALAIGYYGNLGWGIFVLYPIILITVSALAAIVASRFLGVPPHIGLSATLLLVVGYVIWSYSDIFGIFLGATGLVQA